LVGVLPSAVAELPPDEVLAAARAAVEGPDLLLGPAAWVWLALLTVALVAALWERRTAGLVPGLVPAAVTPVVLASGWFREGRAVVAALRWGLALCFLLGSALVWLREPLGRLAARVGIMSDSAGAPALARRLLLGWAAAPVLALTFVIAAAGFG